MSKNRETSIISAIANCISHLSGLDNLGFGISNSNLAMSGNDLEHQSVIEYKLDYHAKLSHGPRTLQHLCCVGIRSTLGVQGLRNVRCLPIPVLLHEYLLLSSSIMIYILIIIIIIKNT